MKVGILHGPGDLRIGDMPLPAIGEDEALLRVRAVGLSSSDLREWAAGRKAPAVLGHEVAGEIADVGSGVRSVRLGDRVFVHHRAPCFACHRCRRGDYVQCTAWQSSGLDPGGLSEFLRIPGVNLDNDTIDLDDSMSFEDGTMVEPLACVMKGIRRAHVKPGDTALVMGLGVMGQLQVLALRTFGVTRIIAADRVDFRLRHAVGIGADQTVDVEKTPLREAVLDLTGGEGAQIVVVNPSDAAAMAQGIGCAGPGGSVLLLSPARNGQRLNIDPNALYFRDINLVSSYSAGPADTAEAMELLSSGRVKADRLVTHRFPLEEAAEAFAAAARINEAIKVIVNP